MTRTTASALLAIDTSTRVVGLALVDSAQVIYEAAWQSNDHHTVELAPAIAEAMRKTGMATDALGALAVANGPGSFTGLRIGMALAKGMAAALGIPIIAVPTLDILAAAQPQVDIPLIAVLKAGRGRLVCGKYTHVEGIWQPLGELAVLRLEELIERIQAATLICGELDEQERSILKKNSRHAVLASPAQSLRRPAFLAEVAWRRWMAGKIDDPLSLAPVYMHFNEPIPG